MDIDGLKRLVNGFGRVRTLVIGDIMLDQFVEANVSRISPEAPVPVAEVVSEFFKPGGAANVIHNITALGGEVIAAGMVGDDPDGERLLRLLRAEVSLEGSCLLVDGGRSTTVKTRILSDGHQIVRVDRERKNPIDHRQTVKLIEFVEQQMERVNAMVISDYDKGLITSELLDAVIPLARRHGRPVVVAPKVLHFAEYKGVNVLVPNLKEASGGTGIRYVNEGSIVEMGQWILSHLGCDATLITRGKDGMSLFEREGKVTYIPTLAKEVYDVTGAGDTVTSVLTLVLGSKGTVLEGAFLANSAASVVVSKVGTATVTQQELLQRIAQMREEVFRTSNTPGV